MLYLNPEVTRNQILYHAAHQFKEGDVLHWWHPEKSNGIRTRYTDDLLWLPYLISEYITKEKDYDFAFLMGFLLLNLLGLMFILASSLI